MSSGPDLEGPGTSGRQEANGHQQQAQQADTTMTAADAAAGPLARVLALYCTSGSPDADQDQGFDPPDACNVSLLSARPGVQVRPWECYQHNGTNTTNHKGCSSDQLV